ncbi:MAG: hypothetical protein A2017_20805 [Lentisphaerae bacterium GWF2_44_16]|nr:MAG: hypothetical protein A2017_20805 [Lentisphaerae bacterium GWF2_44_16]
MEQKGLNEVSSALRSAFQKAQDAIRKENTEYAIEILKGVVQSQPGFTDARTTLRKLEKEKASKMGSFAKMMANIKIAMITAKGKSALKKKPIDAIKAAEEALAIYLYSASALNLLSDAAEALDALFLSIESLEVLRESCPDNETNLRNLARIYELAGEGMEVLKIRQKISTMKPNDLQVQQELRAAAALASMQKGKWEEEGSYQDKLKSKDEAVAIEQEDRIVRDVDDIAEMIERYEKMVNEGDTSIDNRKKLAELYQRANRHDDAIATYNWIIEKLGTMDPAIDRSIEKSIVSKYEIQIEELKKASASEDDIKKLAETKYNYRLERAVDRVNKYPNDMQLRYDLAIVYWDGNFIDNALEQFQYAKKNPHRRLASIVYLGRCFFSKNQFDMAVDQLQNALAEMHVMDKTKMEALYYLGVTFEKMNEIEKAMDCFKQIYQANINYLDVSARMNKYYEKKKS